MSDSGSGPEAGDVNPDPATASAHTEASSTRDSGGVVAIWNPASGSAPDEGELRDALGSDVKLVPTTEDDPGPGQASDAVDAGADIVVACGGDGTIRACLDPLAGTDTSLALVPLGTGNLLGSNLGISSGLDAASTVGKGRVRRIDIGRVNGEAFAVMAGSGFDALMIRDADDDVKSKLGTVAYVASALRNLRTSLIHTEITVDGRRWLSGRTSMVLIGNFGEVSGGLEVFPDAEPDDGLLDIAAVSASGPLQWARLAVNMIRKRDPLDLVRRTTGRSIEITLARPRIYELDGEDRDATSHLEVTVEAGAVSIHQEGDK